MGEFQDVLDNSRLIDRDPENLKITHLTKNARLTEEDKRFFAKAGIAATCIVAGAAIAISQVGDAESLAALKQIAETFKGEGVKAGVLVATGLKFGKHALNETTFKEEDGLSPHELEVANRIDQISLDAKNERGRGL